MSRRGETAREVPHPRRHGTGTKGKNISYPSRPPDVVKRWLERQPPDAGRGFAVVAYLEKAGSDRELAAEAMAALWAESAADSGMISDILRAIPWDRRTVASSMISDRQPRKQRPQMGRFGEVLHAAILEQFDGMTVPVRRYRYDPAPDAPMHGTDIVALEKNADGGERLVYAETKLRTGADYGALPDAYSQLVDASRHAIPAQLAVDLAHVYKGDRDAFMRLLRAASGPIPAHFRIGAIFEKSAWSATYLDRLGDIHGAHGLDMAVDTVKIADLAALVAESYRRVAGHA